MRGKGKFLLFLLFLALGVAGNFVKLTLFFDGLSIMFGGLFLYIALDIIGFYLALPVALVLCLQVQFITGNLWGSFAYLLEFLAVAGMRRYGLNMITADWAYWVVAGIPFVFLTMTGFEGLDRLGSLTTALKFAVNGLMNVTGASLAVLLYRVLLRRESEITFRQAVLVSLVVVAVTPLFLKAVYDSKIEERRMLETVKSDMETITRNVKNQLLYWLDIHYGAVRELANRLVIWGPQSREQLQKDTEAIRRSFNEFHACYIADKDATAITFYPVVNPAGRYMIGTNFNYRPYYKEMKRTYRHVFTRVFIAKFALRPVVGIAVPAIKDGEFIGYAYCGLNLDHAKKLIEEFSLKRGVFITLVDGEGKVITSSFEDLSPLQTFDPGKLKPLKGGLVVSYRDSGDLYFFRREKLREDIPWSVVTQISVRPYRDALFANLVNHFTSIYVITFAAFILTRFLGSLIYTPIYRLSRAMSEIASNIERNPHLDLPRINISDLKVLKRAFEDLAKKVISYTEDLKRKAYYDPLTELPNRTLLKDRIRQAIALAKRENTKVAVLFIDLDYFKTVNDTYGHEVGDRILVQVARRLSSVFRETDTVARFGGDEFVAVITGVKDVEEVIAMAERILSLFESPFDANGDEVYLSASIGITFYPDNGADASTLIKNADMAMYKAKEEGKNSFAFFNEEMNRRAMEILTVKSKIHKALERGEFTLYFQPIYSVEDAYLIGMETLIRWNSPDLGVCEPSKFIDILEELGLIREVGAWVMREAFSVAREWCRDYGVNVSINISPRQFTDRKFLDRVVRTIKEVGADPACVTLEITESSLMYNPEESERILKRLKALGFKVAIDDFGTGYSSLAYLRRLPVDIIKIDISFIKNLVSNPVDRAIISAVVDLSKSLNLRTVAEGVETPEQLRILEHLGCNYAQGFLLGRPMPKEEAGMLLKKERGL
jgi:diguanylate cyclase (GGDEF)-like protein